ncbi:MAG: FAD:protein FMN transferase [Verrucomicrobiales bacterium]
MPQPPHPHRRRRFLAGIGLAAGGAALGALLSRGGRQRLERRTRALGAQVSIIALHPDRRAAELAIDTAFAELEIVEQTMSLYRPDSQICRLNRGGALGSPHPYLTEVLRFAAEISERSGGAFDVTVQPLWDLFRAAQRLGKLPEDAEIDRARRHVDWRRVAVGDKSICLRGEGTAISLNGIAQGFAADRAAAALRAAGIEHALIDCGEFSALGQSGRQHPWRVGIQDPRAPAALAAKAALESGRCLATSGDYATRFTGDFRQHHLFDPASGRSPEALASATVIAPTAMEADASPTAAFVGRWRQDSP